MVSVVPSRPAVRTRTLCSTIAIARIWVARYPITPSRIASADKKRLVSLWYRAATASGSEIESRACANRRSRLASRQNESVKLIAVGRQIQIELMPIA